MEINEVAHSLPTKDGRLVYPARCALTHRSREAIRRVLPAQSSRLNPALEPPGTPIRWGRHSSSRPAADACNAGAARSKKFVRVT